jgi:hypothetical protein
MQTVTLKINDNFYEHFMALVDSLPKKQVKVIQRSLPEHIVISSVEEVKKRVYTSERSRSFSEEEYQNEMKDFFKNELKIAN